MVLIMPIPFKKVCQYSQRIALPSFLHQKKMTSNN